MFQTTNQMTYVYYQKYPCIFLEIEAPTNIPANWTCSSCANQFGDFVSWGSKVVDPPVLQRDPTWQGKSPRNPQEIYINLRNGGFDGKIHGKSSNSMGYLGATHAGEELL